MNTKKNKSVPREVALKALKAMYDTKVQWVNSIHASNASFNLSVSK